MPSALGQERLHELLRLGVGLVHLPVRRDQRPPVSGHRSASTPGQRLALEQLERRAAAGRQVRDRVGQAEALQRRRRVAAADHRRAVVRAPAPPRPPACRRRTARARTRPSGRSRTPCGRPRSPARRPPRVRGPMSSPIQPSGTSRPSITRVSASASKRSASTRSCGSSSRQRRLLGQLQHPPRELDALLLDQRVAGRAPHRAEEAEAHRAADQDRVGDLEEALDHADLVAHLGAAEDDDERVLGVGQQRGQHRHLALEQEAGDRRPQPACHALRGRMRAVRGAEGVVHVHVAEACQRSPRARGRSWSRPARSGCSPASAPRPSPSCCASHSTSGPTTAGAWRTSMPSSSPSRADTGAIEYCGSGPSGRPRCETSTSRAPRSRRYSIVGSAARMRPSSRHPRGCRPRPRAGR